MNNEKRKFYLNKVGVYTIEPSKYKYCYNSFGPQSRVAYKNNGKQACYNGFLNY